MFLPILVFSLLFLNPISLMLVGAFCAGVSNMAKSMFGDNNPEYID